MEENAKKNEDGGAVPQDDEDLEDGEIETDEENEETTEVVVEVKPKEEPEAKKSKSSDDENNTKNSKESKKTESGHHHHHHHHHKSSSKVSKKSTTPAASAAASAAAAAVEATATKKPINDDHMGNIENAIAMALKKDGIEPKTPKISSKTVPEVKTDTEENATISKGSRRRKRKSREKEQQRKKQKLDGDDSDKHYLPGSNDSEDLDEYEMLNVRGGSPPAHGIGVQNSAQMQKQNAYYDSDSYSSGDSYNSSDHRSKRHRSKRRAHERGSRSGNHKGGSRRDKRRRDDSDDESGGNERGIIRDMGGMGGGGGGRNNNNMGPRKQELCKFYLMECCAKGEKCLYMHGDFPCKFYYLGMKNHNRETCKFSHGKPLTDQLRNILLKHLETAPKEIIGDFPRMSRENAVNMINAQHQKLLVKFGMEPDPSLAPKITTQQTNAQQNKAVKIPSLMDLITKFPSPSSENATFMNKKDKPRKTRWCDQNTNESNPTGMEGAQKLHGNNANDDDPGSINLKTLTNVISTDQIEKLAKLGIETVKQVTQLTVLQFIELGLTMQQITELQTILNTQKINLSANNAKGGQQVESSNTAAFSSPYNEQAKDQDMRVQLTKPPDEPLKPSESNEGGNQDVDMRILALPPLPIPVSKQSSIDNISKEQKQTFYSQNSSELASAVDSVKADAPGKQSNDQQSFSDSRLPKIDYSQYLKDANLDFNQSDLDEPLNEETAMKASKENYDSDEDEVGNSLVIEEEQPLEIDESWCPSDNDENKEKLKKLTASEFKNAILDVDTRDQDNESNGTIKRKQVRHEDGDSNSPSSAYSGSSQQNQPQTDDKLLPAVYAPTSIFSTAFTNKIDLSTSVSQYLKTGNVSGKDVLSKIITPDDVKEANETSAENLAHSRSPTTHQREDPRKSTKLVTNNSTSSSTFEFFTRQIPETKHPTPQALDDKLSGHTSSSDECFSPNSYVLPEPPKVIRKSIYEWSDSDSDSEGGSRYNNDRSDNSNLNDESQDSRSKSTSIVSSKDKDMRISSIFIDNDFSNGDIDLRLPFKPVMANYIPATEIDASITSHAPIAYKVNEVEIPKPDYSELRRSIPSHENTLDPRLRRILKIKDEQMDSENILPTSFKSSPFSPPHISSDIDHNHRISSSLTSSTATTASSSSASESVCRPRIDPRRPNVQLNVAASTTASINTTVTQQKPQKPQIDIQNILLKSSWYNDCSTKQKIVVNQQLAIVSTELMKFHADTSQNKIFDLKFIIQNQLLQDILTNLGIYINEDGEFVQLSQSGNNNNTDLMGNSGANTSGIADLMSLPLGSNLDINMDFMRKQQQHQQQQQQQQQQQAMQQAMGVMGTGPRFMGANGPPMMGFGPVVLPNDVIRPGLLGIAPNIPLPTPFNLFEPSQQPNNLGGSNLSFEGFYGRNMDNRGLGLINNNNEGGAIRNNFRSGNGGNRWGNNANNANRDPSMRRHNNNARRDKK